MTLPRLGNGCDGDNGAGVFMFNSETSVSVKAYKLRIVVDNICSVEAVKHSSAKLVEISDPFSAMDRG